MYERQDVGLVLPDAKVLLETGELIELADAKSQWLFCRDQSLGLQITKNVGGEAHWFKRRYTKFVVEGRTIYPQRFTNDVDDWQIVTALKEVRDFMRPYRIPMASPAGMSMALWKQTLNRPCRAYLTHRPFPPQEAMLGGRVTYESGVYDYAVGWDIKSAYQWALQTALVPTTLREEKAHNIENLYQKTGWVDASIIPGLPDWAKHGPLPYRERKRWVYPVEGKFRGIYLLDELQSAVETCERVVPIRAWVGKGIRLPFTKWGAIMERARELPYPANQIMKTAANSLWGSFASSGAGTVRHYTNDQDYKVEKAHRKPMSWILAAHVAAMVRRRLYAEALTARSILAHTDGVIYRDDIEPAGNVGQGDVGDWMRRGIYRDLVVIGANIYSYTNEQGEREHVCAGAPPGQAREVYWRVLKTKIDRGEFRDYDLKRANAFN